MNEWEKHFPLGKMELTIEKSARTTKYLAKRP